MAAEQLKVQLCRLRKLSGMTQEQMAARLDVSRQTISKWEAGSSLPDWESMVRLSRLFQVSLDELAFGKEGREENQTEKQNTNLGLEDLAALNNYYRKKQILLLLALMCFMVSAALALVVYSVDSAIVSMEYMLYRYIAVQEFVYAKTSYTAAYCFSALVGIGGIVCMARYCLLRWKHRKH